MALHVAVVAALPALFVTATSAGAAPGDSAFVIDLGDDWVPRILTETPEAPQAYREMFVAIANERFGDGAEWEGARRDRYHELFGIFPSISVLAARLRDEPRHRCHDQVDGAPLRARAHGAAAVLAVQGHLRCDGLLPERARPGVLDAATAEALATYQRMHMLPSPAAVDAETRQALLTDSRELDFRALLRALRERVADATSLLEDGSARNAWEPVLGRFIDSVEYRQPLRPAALERGAPDLLDRATEAAAIALGWTSPEAAARALAEAPPARTTVRLPGLPDYHLRTMQLRAEIDRGDVWKDFPLDEAGRRRPSPARRRPTLTLFAETDGGEVALVRWPTTIGSWQPERLDGGAVALRYKASATGRWYWRDLVAAPAWFPPPTTPDRELVHRGPDGRWVPSAEVLGPGYRSAYGLLALLHQRPDGARDGQPAYVDFGIRTHGSGNYRSILRGSSHGCHRLFNHQAIRLGGFLLAHHEHTRAGTIEERYARTVRWKGHVFALRVATRGYRYELSPPVPVDVLPGRTVRSRPEPRHDEVKAGDVPRS
jgi:hypothetical protein